MYDINIMIPPHYFFSILWLSTLCSAETSEVRLFRIEDIYLQSSIYVEKAFEIRINQMDLYESFIFSPNLTKYDHIFVFVNSTNQLKNETDSKCFEIRFGIGKRIPQSPFMNVGGMGKSSVYMNAGFKEYYFVKNDDIHKTKFNWDDKKQFMLYHPYNENCTGKNSTVIFLGVPSYEPFSNSTSSKCSDAHPVNVTMMKDQFCIDQYNDSSVYKTFIINGANITGDKGNTIPISTAPPNSEGKGNTFSATTKHALIIVGIIVVSILLAFIVIMIWLCLSKRRRKRKRNSKKSEKSRQPGEESPMNPPPEAQNSAHGSVNDSEESPMNPPPEAQNSAHDSVNDSSQTDVSKLLQSFPMQPSTKISSSEQSSFNRKKNETLDDMKHNPNEYKMSLENRLQDADEGKPGDKEFVESMHSCSSHGTHSYASKSQKGNVGASNLSSPIVYISQGEPDKKAVKSQASRTPTTSGQ